MGHSSSYRASVSPRRSRSAERGPTCPRPDFVLRLRTGSLPVAAIRPHPAFPSSAPPVPVELEGRSVFVHIEWDGRDSTGHGRPGSPSPTRGLRGATETRPLPHARRNRKGSHDDSLPSPTLAEPPRIVAGAGGTLPRPSPPRRAQDSWDAIYLGGAKIGYVHTWVEKVNDKGRDYHRVRIDIEQRLKRRDDEAVDQADVRHDRDPRRPGAPARHPHPGRRDPGYPGSRRRRSTAR